MITVTISFQAINYKAFSDSSMVCFEVGLTDGFIKIRKDLMITRQTYFRVSTEVYSVFLFTSLHGIQNVLINSEHQICHSRVTDMILRQGQISQ